MKKVEIEIPEGKKVECVNGINFNIAINVYNYNFNYIYYYCNFC